MKLHVIGIDLGKTVFHLVGMDSTGKLVGRKRCSRCSCRLSPRICRFS
jgi:transposase